MSRLARLVRLMHTDGRRVPHPNQGGAGTASPVSPSISSHIPTRAPPIKPLPAAAPPPLATSLDPNLTNPDTSAEGITRDGDLPRSPPPKREFTRLGKLVIRRPRRTIPVTLPSGHPEPSTYPPPPEYYEHIKSLQEIRIHPLWQFFHTPPTSRSLLDKNLPHPPFAGFGSIIGLDDLAPANLIQSGRAWKIEELRKKSFADLHILWYVLLKERNVLATQAAELRRLTVQPDRSLYPERKRRCRTTMARIKFVLNERRLGLIAVVGPTMNQPEVPVPTWMDPSGTHLAMRGVVPLPVYTKSTRKGRRMAQAAHGGNPRSETGKPEGQAGDLNPVVATEEVAKEEVESRDEGWGGGKEAERFVAETKVDGGNEVEVAIGESDVDGREEPEHLVSTTDVDSGKLAELFVARSGRRRRKRDADGSRKEAE